MNTTKLGALAAVAELNENVPRGQQACGTHSCTTDGASCLVSLSAVLPQYCCSARAVIGIG